MLWHALGVFMIRNFLFLLLLPGLVACMAASDMRGIASQGARDGGFVSHYRMTSRNRLVLQDTASFLVVAPPGEKQLHGDPELGERVNRYLAGRVYFHFRSHFARTVFNDERPLGFDEALGVARTQDRDYLIYAETLQWDDRGAMLVEDVLPGAGAPDRVVASLRLVEVATGRVVNAWDLSGDSGSLTFFMDSPAHLLDKPLADLVNRLSGHQRPGESVITLF